MDAVARSTEKEIRKRGSRMRELRERGAFMFCCDCGLAVKTKKIFTKVYQNTAICLCRKCALKLAREIAETVEGQMLSEIKEGVTDE